MSTDTLSDLDGAPDGGPPPPPAWYRRRSLLLGVGIAVVLAIAVLTDLPTSQSHASDVAAANAFVYEVNQDLQPCDYAVQEAYTFRQEQLNGTLSAENRAHLGSQLNDDAVACSYVDPSVTDLTSLDSPSTTASQPLGQMLAQSTLWVASDAQQAIGAIQTLSTDPTSASGLKILATETRHLATDRAIARASVVNADRVLRANLNQVNLPVAIEPTVSTAP